MKTILVTMMLLAGIGTSFGQGFWFANSRYVQGPRAAVYGPEPGDPGLQKWGNEPSARFPGTQSYAGLRLEGTNYSAEGFYSLILPSDTDVFALMTNGLPLAGSLTVFGTGTNEIPINRPSRGFFDAGYVFVDGPNRVWVQVRCWDNAGGQLDTWSKAWNAALTGSRRPIGWSKVFLQPVTYPPGPEVSLFYFESFNLAVLPQPALTIRVSEVEVCWNAELNKTYQAQYRSEFTTNRWTDLGSPVPGTGATNCLTDRVLPGQAQRYYRVLTLP